jgi:hypothetical protein
MGGWKDGKMEEWGKLEIDEIEMIISTFVHLFIKIIYKVISMNDKGYEFINGRIEWK